MRPSKHGEVCKSIQKKNRTKTTLKENNTKYTALKVKDLPKGLNQS